MRVVSTRVLPDPAPARTRSGPSWCSTASRTRSFFFASSSRYCSARALGVLALFGVFLAARGLARLGLGLVISAKIVHEFGGTLRAEKLAQGMSFEFDLAVETWTAVPETNHV